MNQIEIEKEKQRLEKLGITYQHDVVENCDTHHILTNNCAACSKVQEMRDIEHAKHKRITQQRKPLKNYRPDWSEDSDEDEW